MKKALIKLFASSGFAVLLLQENALALNAKFRDSDGGSELYDLDVLYCVFEFVIFEHRKKDDILSCAAINGQLEVVKYMIEYGADIHVREEEALRWAASKGQLEIVKYLIGVGTNIHARSDDALYWAIMNEHPEVVAFLKSQLS